MHIGNWAGSPSIGIALLRNQAMALLRHERIETTVPKAKELRPFVERLITIAKRGVAAGDANGKTLHARRHGAGGDCRTSDVVGKLFETLAPRFAERPGGYTRILRVGYRRGDGAEVAQVELVGSEYDPKPAEAEKDAEEDEAPKKAKGVGERLKRAAQRIRGDKGEGGSKAQAGGQTKGRRRSRRRRGRPAGRSQTPKSQAPSQEKARTTDVAGPFVVSTWTWDLDVGSS